MARRDLDRRQLGLFLQRLQRLSLVRFTLVLVAMEYRKLGFLDLDGFTLVRFTLVLCALVRVTLVRLHLVLTGASTLLNHAANQILRPLVVHVGKSLQ